MIKNENYAAPATEVVSLRLESNVLLTGSYTESPNAWDADGDDF